MKKLITICLFMATTFAVNAQEEKPTKEQTINFMKAVLNGAKGTELSEGYFINSIEFDGTNYSYSCGKKMGSSGFKFETINIPWSEFKEFDSDHVVDDNIVSVIPNFNIKVEGAIYLYENGNNSKSATYQDDVVLIIPVTKVESFKKGILRLIELSKEVNNDPFAK